MHSKGNMTTVGNGPWNIIRYWRGNPVEFWAGFASQGDAEEHVAAANLDGLWSQPWTTCVYAVY